MANTSIRPSWYVPNEPNIVDHFPFFRSVLTYNVSHCSGKHGALVPCLHVCGDY